ncbi:ABC transporter permease [Bacteroides cellulosilyticus]|jgi:putative ABC transport system permease protein|uniref:ABC transporter permease n=1 Tax=Bacteroides cellulosilyticus TaxID=246787 RepID=A0A412ILD1_9BACE|nr:ABC transporter permease [Bacteroides cellulosilyticus]RGS38575.1 ABC transporter permease [Bacteroides cellulosilyticus]
MKQFIRNFNKQKVVGTLNICSLSLSIMVSIVVGLWAINELTYDNFYSDGDRMYRVVQNFELNGKPIRAATSFKPLGEIAEKELPSIEKMCRIVSRTMGVTFHNMVHFGVPSLVTDHNFFSFFGFPLKEGDIETAFSGTNNAIITESAARKYFPDEDPIGQRIVSHGYDFFISGIMYDIPRNSHIQAEVILPMFGSFKSWEWDSGFYYDTYFILSPSADLNLIGERLTQINKAGAGDFLKNAYNEVGLELVRDIHFSKTEPGFDNAVKGDKSFLQILVFTALVILIIGCINFTNLFISTAFIRARSIGIKKSQGAGRRTLILEFYKETAVYVFISVVGGLLLAMLTLPVFNNYTGSTTVLDFYNPQLYVFLFCLIIVTILIAGSFPAFRMTKFGIIETIGGKFRGKKMSAFQKALVIIQFTSSISLLIIVFFFGRQIDTLLSQDLGFDNKNVFYVNGWGAFGADYKSLRNELRKNPAIADVAMKQYDLPLRMGNGVGVRSLDGDEAILIDLSEVSPNYFDFFDMEFLAGENPLWLETAANSRYCVINEAAARALGLEDNPVDASFMYISIGQKLIENDGKTYTVKGVIRDSYVKSLHETPGAQMYLNLSRDDHNPIFIRTVGNPQDAIQAMEKMWKEINPNVPFEYHFLDETYDAQYKAEMNARNVLSYALLITFIISAAGLFAIAFYSTQRRIKEIGIRKINGAKVTDLLLLLNKDVVVWVVISFLIACPIAYVFLYNWLDDFVVKTSLSWWVFLIAGVLSALVALITVSYQTWRTATTNPIESLKTE